MEVKEENGNYVYLKNYLEKKQQRESEKNAKQNNLE